MLLLSCVFFFSVIIDILFARYSQGGKKYNVEVPGRERGSATEVPGRDGLCVQACWS